MVSVALAKPGVQLLKSFTSYHLARVTPHATMHFVPQADLTRSEAGGVLTLDDVGQLSLRVQILDPWHRATMRYSILTLETSCGADSC